MRKARILSVVGARPNFMKMAPVLRGLSECAGFESRLVHTGQHYDDTMSDVFFRDLGMPRPDANLNVGGGSHASQTADVMKRFEPVCEQIKPDLVIVAGDVNSTVACALTAVKLRVPVAHIEAGLRSFDRGMPEEINRIVTDAVSNLLFTTETSGNDNLCREGVDPDKVHHVGNTMIDSLVRCVPMLDGVALDRSLAALASQSYIIATIHRPANVDDPSNLSRVLCILEAASERAPILFVAHPRTQQSLSRMSAADRLVTMDDATTDMSRGHVYLLPPLGYLQFLKLMSHCTAVLTDSGGIQEEATFLHKPCLTLRTNTERPVTVELGTNQIVGLDQPIIMECLGRIMRGDWKDSSVPPYWDGRASERIIRVLKNTLITS